MAFMRARESTTDDDGTITRPQSDYIGFRQSTGASQIERLILELSPGLPPAESDAPVLESEKDAPPPHIEAIQWIRKATHLSDERIGRLLGVSRQALNNWDRGGSIQPSNRQRLFAVREVLERAASSHRTPDELTSWLETPRGVDGLTPEQLLAQGEINRARLLAVSSPSAGLKDVPSWVGRPTTGGLVIRGEYRPRAEPPDSDEELARLITAEAGEDDDWEAPLGND